jgi:carbohydrate-binding DOMON domain-containing protein
MRAYDRLILVGGGVQVEDAEGKALAAYIPVEGDVLKPLGNAGAGSIDFAIPLSYLGKPKRSWTFVVLSGGQDDHGGAGLGEFRTVLREVSEWQGGGKTRPDHPNVYDVLLIGPK